MPLEEVDLLTYDYIDREFSILNGKYIFKFKQARGFINEFQVWLGRNELFFADNFLKALRI